MITQEQFDKCVEVAKRYGAKKLILFGSATENMEQARDIDLLCYGLKEIDVLRMAGMMKIDAGASVDVIPADSETPFVKFNLARGKVLYDIARAA